MVFDYGVPFNLLVKQRWPGATLSIFDTNALLNDIFNNPSQYLDAPAKSTGVYHSCSAVNTSDCVNSPDPISSFLWYDELHPTEKTRKSVLVTFSCHVFKEWSGAYKSRSRISQLTIHRHIYRTRVHQCRCWEFLIWHELRLGKDEKTRVFLRGERE